MSKKYRSNSDIFHSVLETEKAKKNNPKWQAYFEIYFKFLMRNIITLYRWDNLPDTMDGIYLERCLMYHGVAGMYKNDKLGYINVRCTWGEIGIYGKPIYSTFYTANGIIDERVYVGYDSDNAVIVFNNNEGLPYINLCATYSARLADITVAHIINIDAQKTPVTLVGDFTQLEQLSKAYLMYAGGSPVIPQRRRNSNNDRPDLMEQGVTVLKTDAPFVADELHQEFDRVLHEFYSLVGINFANNQKRYQMLAAEVTANNQEVLTSALTGLQTRVYAADLFNKIHGTDISVHLSIDPISMFPTDVLDNIYVTGGDEELVKNYDPNDILQIRDTSNNKVRNTKK